MRTTDHSLRLPEHLPHDETAEAMVLASLLIDSKHVMPVARRLNIGDFYEKANQIIFQTMLDLAESNGDAFTEELLVSALQHSGELDNVGGLEYLAQLASPRVVVADIEPSVETILHKMELRRLMTVAISVIENCIDHCDDTDMDVMGLVNEIENEILEIAKNHTPDRTLGMRELIIPAMAYLQQLANKDVPTIGLPTGIVDLDRLITLRPGEMIVLAARAAFDKTVLAMNIATHIALRHHKPVGIFSLGMSSEMLAVRLLCSEAEIRQKDIRNGSVSTTQWQEVAAAADRLQRVPIFIDETPALDILELRAKTRQMHAEHQIECLFINDLQLLRLGSGTCKSHRGNEMARIAGIIKVLAKELHIPIVLLSLFDQQVEVEERQPNLNHLYERETIESDADIVIQLCKQRFELEVPRRVTLVIAKNRNGPTGKVNLQLSNSQSRFFQCS